MFLPCCILLSLAIGIIETQTITEDNYINYEIKKKLKLHEEPFVIQSKDYPGQAPARIKQTWSITSYPWIRIQLECDKITIPEHQPCKKSYFEVFDGTDTHRYCEQVNNLVITSTSNKLDVTFKSREILGGGKFICSIVGFNPEFTTLAPATTTESYLKIKSIEIDSSEHGMKSGNKSTTCPCGKANKNRGRIVGGKIVSPNEYPFIAALASKEVGIPFCGATIITSYHAITAAHCTIKILEYNVDSVIFVAEHDYMADSEIADVYNVKQILQHEDYNVTYITNDISILVVDREIQFNTFVGKVCLPNKRLELPHQYVTMLGWGRTAINEPSSTVLREVKARIIPTRDCTDIWGSYIQESSPKHLCTYATGKTTCKGDSGGPILWVDPETNRYTLVGLTSFGLNCSPKIPSVKTEVAAFLDWIDYQIRRTTPSGRSEICTKLE